MRECLKNKKGSGNSVNIAQSSSVSQPDRVVSRGVIFGTGGGENHLYAITSIQEQENSLDVIMGIIKFFTSDVYALLCPGASLFFVTSYVANQFEIRSEKFCEPFCVSTHFRESTLAERVYRDCLISINHKSTMDDLIELDMVDFDVFQNIAWLHGCYA